MDFGLTAEQRAMRDAVRRFGESEIAPVADAHDADERYPHEIMKSATDMDLVGAHIPTGYGGAGYSALEFALLVEELAAIDPGIGLCITSAGFGADEIAEYGSETQRERYLPPIPKGESVMGMAVTEPHAGSDVTAITTTATPAEETDEWVINGTKTWITNGTVGDYFVVLCETDPDVDDRYLGFSQIIVEADRDGFLSEEITGKLGVRASDTATLTFDDVRVPHENLLGTRGLGFPQLMAAFDRARAMVAAQAVGIAQGAVDLALEYAREREQFGQPIGEFQTIQHTLAEMAMHTEAARHLTYRSAWAIEEERDELTALASMAKAFAAEVALEVTADAIQIHGGSGYVRDTGIERFYRDAKITGIYEGTTQIQKNIIARKLLGKGW